ncbi:hypothetical protein A4S05_05745 [Nostoc sp. KVJ20]|nr:hypothetical protein A4S05_05745 [Nostoc sp. KVJ20]
MFVLDLYRTQRRNGTKKSPKACVVSFPAWRLGMYLKEALPQFKLLEAEPPRMDSQPGGLFQSEQGLYLFLVPFDSTKKCYFY